MIDLHLGMKAFLEVLCIGAHPDDIEIGCGGTLLAMSAERPVHVTAVVMTGDTQRRAETLRTLPRFVHGAPPVMHVHALTDGRLPDQWNQVKDILEEQARHGRPDVILAPRRDDAHQDHRILGELVTTVWRDALLLHYEIPKWDGDLGPVTHYVPLRDELVRAKLDFIRTGFPSQVTHDWWDDETFRSLLRLRGVECRNRYAEGFVSYKTVLSWTPLS